MTVFILKEGKEYNQGVAYLDDGTMVVVDNARQRIGKNVDIVVTSVLQTTAGRMIFGKCAEQAAPQDGPRRRESGRPRRHRPPAAPRRTGVTLPPFHWWRTVFFLIPAIVDLHDRARHRVARRRPRSMAAARFAHACAQLWARLILWTSGVRDRARGARAAADGRELRLRRQSLEHLRHPDPVHRAAAAAADHGEGGARLRAVHRLAPARAAATCWSNRKNPAPAIFKRMQRMARSGASLIVFPEGIAHDATARVKRFKGGIFLLAIENGLPIVPVSVVGQPDRDAEGAVHGRVRRRCSVTVHDADSDAGPDARGRARAGRARARHRRQRACSGGA